MTGPRDANGTREDSRAGTARSPVEPTQRPDFIRAGSPNASLAKKLAQRELVLAQIDRFPARQQQLERKSPARVRKRLHEIVVGRHDDIDPFAPDHLEYRVDERLRARGGAQVVAVGRRLPERESVVVDSDDVGAGPHAPKGADHIATGSAASVGNERPYAWSAHGLELVVTICSGAFGMEIDSASITFHSIVRRRARSQQSLLAFEGRSAMSPTRPRPAGVRRFAAGSGSH